MSKYPLIPPKAILLIAVMALSCYALFATMVINENIQSWDAHTSYGSYTEEIPAGTVLLSSCLVSPNAAASGSGSAGRIQCQAATGAIELPEISSAGEVEFTFAAGSAGRSIRLQRFSTDTWVDITTFTGITASAASFYYRVGIGQPTKLRLAMASHAVYIHDIFVTTNSTNPLPELSLPTASNVTYSSALMQGIIESGGSTAVTERGFCYSLSPLPDINGTHTAFGSGISPLSGTITGLEASSTYYVRAYATNSAGTAYSPEIQIVTLSIQTPTVQTSNIELYPGNTSVQVSWTPGNGSRRLVKINTTNSFTPPTDGIDYPANPVYSTTGEQVIYFDATQMVEGEEVNTIAVTGLQRNTTYWFRAYEVNGAGANTHYLGTTAIANPLSCTTLNMGLAGYYDQVSGHGADLKQDLHELLRTTHLNQFSYDALWQQLQYTDEDSLNANNVIETYTGWSVPKNHYGTGADQWNREHTWSVSHGNFGTSRPAGTDLHHLRPCDVTVNSAKGNKDFDNGGSPYTDSTPYGAYNAATGCNTATNHWEPRPVEKGDVARMLMYMAVRYEGTDTSYNLEMQDTTPTTGSFYGKLSTLLQWHYDDPPDGYERRRNDRIQERQGNRNPFIDHPEFVGGLWVPSISFAYPSDQENATIIWTDAINAQSYRMDVSADSLFGSFIIQDEDFGNSQIATIQLGDHELAYARIRAFFGSGYSPWSQTYRIDMNLPETHVSYFNGTAVENEQVLLDWTTQYEYNLIGFRLYRSLTPVMEDAVVLVPMITASNTSTPHYYSFTDNLDTVLENGGYLYYWLAALCLDATEIISAMDSVYIEPTDLQDDVLPPASLMVSAYPNPFGSFLNISFAGKDATPLNLTVYNLKGQKVISWKGIDPAKQSLVWNGCDEEGQQLAAGVYLLRVNTSQGVVTRKLLKLKQ